MEESRVKKLEKLRKLGVNPYPYRYEVSDFIGEIRSRYEREIPSDLRVRVTGRIKRVSRTDEGFMIRIADEENVEMPVFTDRGDLKPGDVRTFEGILSRTEGKLCLLSAVLSEQEGETVSRVKAEFDRDPAGAEVSLAGRLVTLRTMGKAIFGHVQDLTGRIQIYLRQDVLGEEKFSFFNKFVDLGDILGVKGRLFRTRTGELTVEVSDFELLTKCLHPLPEKWHGVRDVEVRYRQRYLDLIANPSSRRIFLLRSRLITEMRRFLDERGFVEVETPILQPVASGAAAKPFTTHHNYLDMTLYLRIAPELYLKKLIVGGFPRVYEIGRNFRNEGVDRTHNPEFTMVEFYAAFWDYTDLMKFTEEMMTHLLMATLGTLKISYKGYLLDFTPPYRRIGYFELLEEKTGRSKEFFLRDPEGVRLLARELEVPHWEKLTHAKLLDKIFEKAGV